VSKQYTSPSVQTLGSVHELTAQEFNPGDKVGSSADALTQVAAQLGLGVIDGTIIPDPPKP
jgi:hypothetical protein